MQRFRIGIRFKFLDEGQVDAHLESRIALLASSARANDPEFLNRDALVLHFLFY